jgi:hypothetical protein
MLGWITSEHVGYERDERFEPLRMSRVLLVVVNMHIWTLIQRLGSEAGYQPSEVWVVASD